MIPKTILFCTDFSENSADARECAAAYSRVFDSSLYVLHVIEVSGVDLLNFSDSSDVGLPPLASGLPLQLKSDIQEVVRENTSKALEGIRLELADKVKNVTTYIREGNPATEIIRFAEDYSVDLIIIGTHGWTGFKHLIMGSTAENVIRKARCPVLTVKSSIAQGLLF